ncbi:MAG: hypothetical protein RLZZ111_1520 [Planctomycetota bacterium]|jgi:hypothetical protein
MPSTDPLSRLLAVLQPSLAMYLADSGIWSHPGKEATKLALADLVDDHRSLIERAGSALEDRGIVPSAPAYPIAFTGSHDVDIQSLVPRVLEGLRKQVGDLAAILESGQGDDVALALAREAKTSSEQHLDALAQAAAR